MLINEKAEEFFLTSLNTDKMFDLIERQDYFFLYHMKHYMEKNEIAEWVYIADLAKDLSLSIHDISKKMHILQDKGYVIWKTDDKKERTCVSFTSKAKDQMKEQKRKINECYQEMMQTIDEKDLEVTVATVKNIRSIMNHVM